MKLVKICAALLPILAFGQESNYWQQQVAYEMAIDMDVKSHRFTGEQKLRYTNNSPDTIEEVFYHLYFNAFQPQSMMDLRSRHIADPDKRVGARIEKLDEDEIGYHQVESLSQDGAPLQYEVRETVLKAALATPLLPGETTELNMKFNSQVPVQIRRSGRDNAEGIDYTMTQWYPKLAAYDEDGWHPDPYVGREFYADFGNFDVTINIDSDQKLAATGVLQNPDNYWETQAEENGVKKLGYKELRDKKRSWHFIAEQVHDFAWAADEKYLHYQTEGNNGLELNFFFLEKYIDTWEQLPAATVRFFELMNKSFGTYPYPQFSVIQGGDGGMEYPMCTMLKGTGKLKGLIGVMAHESAHNWYYGVLASNEFQYPWMDEGFTSFAEDEVLNMMAAKPELNPHENAYQNYFFMVKKDEVEPLATPADYFSRNRSYGISAYSRGTIFLNQLKYIMGEDSFNKAMLVYFDRWKFKHPDPWDFLRVMERESGLQLDWYLNFMLNTEKTIDYAIKGVEARESDQLLIELERKGEMPMPVDVYISTSDGRNLRYTIPLVSMFGAKHQEDVEVAKPWAWTAPVYRLSVPVSPEVVESVIIDPLNYTADTDRENNRKSFEKKSSGSN